MCTHHVCTRTCTVYMYVQHTAYRATIASGPGAERVHTVLLLRAPRCRAGLGRHFDKDEAVAVVLQQYTDCAVLQTFQSTRG